MFFSFFAYLLAQWADTAITFNLLLLVVLPTYIKQLFITTRKCSIVNYTVMIVHIPYTYTSYSESFVAITIFYIV